MEQYSLEPPIVTAAGPKATKIILVLIALIYGVLLVFLSAESPAGFFNSPDEMANFVFAKNVAEKGYLAIPVVHPDLPSSVTPRSMLRNGNIYIPVAFVSFPVLLGLFITALTIKGVFILFPLLGFLSILAWYGFLKSMFGTRIALVSVFITAIHPAVLYWGQRPFSPNVWFLMFVFFSLYFITRAIRFSKKSLPREGVNLESPTIKQPRTKRGLSSLIAGLTFGIAIALRPQEGVWLVVVPLYILFSAHLRKRMSFMLFTITTLIPLGGLLMLQSSIYGSPINTGYHLTPLGGTPPDLFKSVVKNMILLFGLNFKSVVSVIYAYWVDIFWWIMLFAILGLGFIIARPREKMLKRLRSWSVGTMLVGIWLLIFYGSFIVQDRIDLESSIGTSFTRYFLPFYVMIIPVIAYGLFRLRMRFGRVLIAGVIVIMVVLSVRVVFLSTDESIVNIAKSLHTNKEVQKAAGKVLPKDAIVLTERSDKIFFPKWDVVTRFRQFHQPDFEELYGLDLYYETFADNDFVELENKGFWGPHRLKAVDPVNLGYRHYLYKLELID